MSLGGLLIEFHAAYDSIYNSIDLRCESLKILEIMQKGSFLALL